MDKTQKEKLIVQKQSTMFSRTIKNIKTAKLLLGLSIFAFAYFLICWILIDDIYQYAAAGAIYELLWLPMLLSLVAIPLLSILIFITNKGKPRIYAALAVLLIIGSFIILTNH